MGYNMKAYIIGDKHNRTSVQSINRCAKSLKSLKSKLKVEFVQQTSPESLENDLLPFPGLAWNYPLNNNSRIHETKIKLPGYRASSLARIFSCTISHAKLWLRCIHLKEPIMILEHDAIFMRDFIPFEWEGGVLGLNDPRGATHSSQLYHDKVSANKGVQDAPWVKSEKDMPQGLAGNSAYIIKPHFASMLLEKLKKEGAWPNDAIMCKQFFPNELKVVYPYYTTVQGIRSTTTF